MLRRRPGVEQAHGRVAQTRESKSDFPERSRGPRGADPFPWVRGGAATGTTAGKAGGRRGGGEDAMVDEQYDAIVIGTSQGGRFLPIELAKAGQRVALVERGPLGGTCVNTGCTPTKTMVASARLAHQARRGAEYGVHGGSVSVDLAAVRERKRALGA